MNEQDLFTLVRCQVLQVTATIVLVWLLVQLFARKRPHLATALWMVVLLKCLTPPILTSPVALFAMLPTIDFEEPQPPETIAIQTVEPIEFSETHSLEPVEIDPLSRGYEIEWDDPLLFSEELPAEPISAEMTYALPPAAPKFPPLWKWWLISASTALFLIFLRVLVVLRGVRKQQTETPREILELVESLRQRLKISRSIRVCVTLRKVGPAVIGLFRPTIILPQAVIEGRSADELEPIIAHELLHIRRGDLGVGWLRLFAQALWWFHPLVWLVNRCLSRETERCCDEAVLAELKCSPAHYARCLLHVLEQKRNLSPIPAFPGVKPVEITKRRMERIMQLGQGSRKRTPLWCWLVVLILGAVVLPGDAKSEEELQYQIPVVEESKAALFQEIGTVEQEFQVPQLARNNQTTDESRLTKTYQIGKLITRLETEYELEPEIAPLILTNLIRVSLQNVTASTNNFQPVKDSPPKLVLSNGNLVVSATKKYHAAAEKLISTWEQHGLYEVKLEVRFATHSEKLELPGSLAQLKVERGSETLDEKQMFELIQILQGDARSNILYAPKITMSHGTQALIQDQVQRPFVTDIINGKPKIEILPDGIAIKLAPVVQQDGSVQLDSNITFSTIKDVATKTLDELVDGKPVKVQVVDFHEEKIETNAKIPAGKSIAIRGPNPPAKERRQEAGRNVWDKLSGQFGQLLGSSGRQEKIVPQEERMLILITPRVEKLDRENLLALGIDPIDVLNAKTTGDEKPQTPKLKIPQGSVQFKFDLPKDCQLDIPQANVPYTLEDVRLKLEPITGGQHTSYITRTSSSAEVQVGTIKPRIIHTHLYSLTLQTYELTDATRIYVNHNAVPIKVVEEDLDQLDANNFVTKVYYLADGQTEPVKSQLEVLVNTRLDPSVDPVAEADRRGTVVAVMRLANVSGKILFGTGVNSDAGVSGQLTVDEKKFETERTKDQPEVWSPGTVLSGRIVNSKDEPLVGARVMLVGNQELEIKAGQWKDYLRPGGFQSIARPSVFTDEEGRFKMTGPVSPTNRLAIMHETYRLHVVSANEVKDERSISIKLPQPSSLVVRVEELRPEELSDIVVSGTGAYRTHIHNNKFALALTDFQKQQDGSFLISGLPQGAYSCRDQKNVRWIPSARNDSEVKRIAVAPVLSGEYRPGQRMNLAQHKAFMKRQGQPSPIATYRAEEYRSIQIDKPGSKLTLDLNANGNRRAIPGRILGLENPTKDRLFVMVEANASVLRRQLPRSVHWTGLSIHHTSRASADGKFVFQEIANGDYEFTVITRSIKDGPPELKAYLFPALSIDSATKEIVLDIRKATPSSSERSITRPGALISPAAAPNHLASDQPTKKGSEQRKKSTGKLQTVVYPVADLVVPIVQENEQSKRFRQIPGTNTGVPITDTPIGLPGPPHLPRPAPPVDGPGPGVILPQPVHNPLGAPAGLKSHTIRNTQQRDHKQNTLPLIELIDQTLGEAKMPLREQSKIVFSESTLSLVIRAKSTQHDVIQQLLATLRREQDIQVTLECLTVRFDKDSFDDFWANHSSEFVPEGAPTKTTLPFMLHGARADDFLAQLNKLKQAHVLSAPKVTVFNGVGAEIQIGAQVQIVDGKTMPVKSANSMHYLLIPTVSEDRRKVEVKFAINPENILDAVSKSKSFTIADGRSILFEVTDDLIAEDRKGTVPGVSQAVREMKKKQLGERTFVLLTPTIIVQEEEEEKMLMQTPRGVILDEEEPLLDNLNDVPLNRLRKR